MTSSATRRTTPKPRSWIADPAARQSFGRVLEVGWSSSDHDPGKQVMIGAARMQHRIAIHLRRYAAAQQAAGETGWSFPDIAERLETVDYDGLMRLMRGDVQISLLHIADLSRVFGTILTFSDELKKR